MRSDPAALTGLAVLARHGATITTDPALLAGARRRFGETHALVLQGFLAPELLAWTQARIAESSFEVRQHLASGAEACMPDNEAVYLLRFLLESREVLDFVSDVTGVAPLDGVKVRIYRLMPGTDQQHDWHDDWSANRQLGLSVNLSESDFEGGRLQVRRASTEVMTADVHNTGAGDLVIFRLGEDVDHRVLPVTGRTPRTALAGWFLGGPAHDA